MRRPTEGIEYLSSHSRLDHSCFPVPLPSSSLVKISIQMHRLAVQDFGDERFYQCDCSFDGRFDRLAQAELAVVVRSEFGGLTANHQDPAGCSAQIIYHP